MIEDIMCLLLLCLLSRVYIFLLKRLQNLNIFIMYSKSENKKLMNLKASLIVPKEKIALKHNFSLQSSEKTMSTSYGITTVMF